MYLQELPLGAVVLLFLAAAGGIAFAGVRLTAIADELAIRTGWGEAVMGALFVGASTSLPGIVTSVVTAVQGYASLATANALGGIAAQTSFLGVADLAYRKVNLEHAAASLGNLFQGALLIALIAIALTAANLPPVEVFGLSPATVILVVSYISGVRLLASAGAHPMWRPYRTRETQWEEEDVPTPGLGSTRSLWLRFAGLAPVLAVLGYVVSQTGVALALGTGLSETAVGTLFTAVATSLPELVTAVAAVRQGALNLAVGNVIGGNCFDILFLAGADVGYRAGPLYPGFTPDDRLLAGGTVLMTAVLLLGLLRRQRHGPAGIGFESTLVLLLYAGLLVAVST